MQATHKTAAAAGVWTGLGVASLQAWLDHHAAASSAAQDTLWVLTSLVFLGIPAFLFVFGRGVKPFQRDFLVNAHERARQAEVFKRLFVWFVAAGCVGTVVSLALGAVVR